LKRKKKDSVSWIFVPLLFLPFFFKLFFSHMEANDRVDGLELWTATVRNDLNDVLVLLNKGYSRFISSPYNISNTTPLHEVCIYGKGDSSKILKMFLKYPGIDVNVRAGHTKVTAFACTCSLNTLACGKLLLADPRVNLHTACFNGLTPLDVLITNHRDTTLLLKHWIASGRPLMTDFARYANKSVRGSHYRVRDDAFEILKAYTQNPVEAIHKARLEIEWFDPAAARLFAMLVFLCDGLLVLKPRDALTEEQIKIARFWNMAQKLPLDLQYVLTCRAVGSDEVSITSANREAAFSDLALHLLENP
jgi:hypothetical protein